MCVMWESIPGGPKEAAGVGPSLPQLRGGGSVLRRTGVFGPFEAGRFVVFVEVGFESESLVALLATVVLER